jgi:hypothetical protein
LFAFAVLASLAALFGAIAVWLWLCGGLMRPGWRGTAGKLAVQLSALLFVWGALPGNVLNGMAMAFTAPLSLVAELGGLKAQEKFVTAVFWPSAPFGGAVLLASLAIAPLRIWAPGLALLTGLIAALWQGEGISQRAMCETAARHGVTSFPRNSLLWSLGNAPQEFQFEIHARIEANGQRFGWSYREMDWYPIPNRATADVTGPTFTCP